MIVKSGCGCFLGRAVGATDNASENYPDFNAIVGLVLINVIEDLTYFSRNICRGLSGRNVICADVKEDNIGWIGDEPVVDIGGDAPALGATVGMISRMPLVIRVEAGDGILTGYLTADKIDIISRGLQLQPQLLPISDSLTDGAGFIYSIVIRN